MWNARSFASVRNALSRDWAGMSVCCRIMASASVAFAKPIVVRQIDVANTVIRIYSPTPLMRRLIFTANRDEFFLGMCVGNRRMATGLRKLFLRPGSDANLPVGLTDIELHFSAQKFQQRDRFRGGENTADTQRPQLGTFEQDLLFII